MGKLSKHLFHILYTIYLAMLIEVWERRRVAREHSPHRGVDNPQAAAAHQSSSRSLHSFEANERSKRLRGPLMTQGKSPEGDDTNHAKKSVNNRANRAGTSKLGRDSLMNTTLRLQRSYV